MRVSRRYKQCFASQRGKSTTRIFAATWAPLSYGTRVGAPFRLLLVRAYSTLKGVWQHIRRTIAGAISQPGSWIREPYASIPIQFVIIQSRPIDKASPASRFLRLCQRRLVRQRVQTMLSVAYTDLGTKARDRFLAATVSPARVLSPTGSGPTRANLRELATRRNRSDADSTPHAFARVVPHSSSPVALTSTTLF